MATISYQPWYQGDTFPAWDIPLATDAGNEDITNVNLGNFTMIFRNLNGIDTVGAGTFSVKAFYPAEVYYKPAPADVASAFNGYIIIKALYPPSNSTADEVVFDPIPFSITAS